MTPAEGGGAPIAPQKQHDQPKITLEIVEIRKLQASDTHSLCYIRRIGAFFDVPLCKFYLYQ